MRTRGSVLAIVVELLGAAAPVWAHHAFAAEFDIKKPVKLEGKVTTMEWTNPHAWIHIDVTGPDGKVTNWMVECGSPNVMLRRGFTKRSLEAGTELTVEGYQAKNGEFRANGSSVTFKDGKRIFVGGSNPDDLGNSGRQ
ncbi:MAG: hypothetical protein KGM92_02530 [Acidobacteriota bacterium]|nr:hypothetical protein [Acidobacteriota bacterium]